MTETSTIRPMVGTSRKVLAVALAVAVAASAAASSGQATARSLDDWEYVGNLTGQKGKALFDVVNRDGKRFNANVRFRGVTVQCDDGSTRRQGFSGIEAKFKSARVFHAQDYLFEPDTGSGEQMETKGTIRPNGKAKGWFRYVSVRQPNPVADPPDCYTDGRVRWTARLQK